MSELRKRVRAFAMGAEAGLAAAPDEASAARQALQLLGQAGLLEYAVAKPGAGPVLVKDLCDVRYELARSSGMLDVVFAMQGLGTCPLTLGGTPDQAAETLPRVLAGKDVAAFALTEPDTGSDLSRVSTSAMPSGEGWTLNGHKTFISNAPLADVYTVLARTAGEPGDKQGLSMFLVGGQVAGIRVEGFEVMAPHPIGDVYFSDVSLDKGALIGFEGGGLDLALATLGHFRTSVAAAACGMARRALDESLAHLQSRQQFGRPLARFQGLRMDLAEMDTRLRAAELLVDEAANAVDGGQDAVREVARAKLFATENAGWICDRAVQHLGGLGVKRGHVVERLYREVRALRIYEGTSEIQKLILAKAALEAAKL